MNTKNFRKAPWGLVSIVFALLAAFTPRAVQAANAQDAASAWYGSQSFTAQKFGGTVPTIAFATTTSLMNLYYTGQATAAYVTIGASSITFFAPFNVNDTSLGGTSYASAGGTFDLTVASGSTLGPLCDLINGIGPFALNGAANGGAPTGGNWHCTLTGGIRNDPYAYLPNLVETSGTNNAASQGGFDVPVGTQTILSLGIIPSAGKHVILNYCTVNAAGTPQTYVYGSLAKNGVGAQGLSTVGGAVTNDSTLVWVSSAVVANTATNYPLSTVSGFPWLEFGGGSGSAWRYYPGPAGAGMSLPVGNQYNGHVVVRVNNYGLGAPIFLGAHSLGCNWTER